MPRKNGITFLFRLLQWQRLLLLLHRISLVCIQLLEGESDVLFRVILHIYTDRYFLFVCVHEESIDKLLE